GTRLLVESARAAGVGAIIYAGTISSKYKERGVYGETKAEAQRVIEESKIPSVTLMLSVVYADAERGIVGSLARYARLPVTPLVGPGTATYRPVHADDVAEAIARVLKKQLSGAQVYEFGGPEEISLN